MLNKISKYVSELFEDMEEDLIEMILDEKLGKNKDKSEYDEKYFEDLIINEYMDYFEDYFEDDVLNKFINTHDKYSTLKDFLTWYLKYYQIDGEIHNGLNTLIPFDMIQYKMFTLNEFLDRFIDIVIEENFYY